jgi:hypothetical protein
MRIRTLALAALLLPAAAIAQIYQWKDAAGKVHYSDQPPPSAMKQERTFVPRGMTPAPAAPASEAPPASPYEEQDTAFRQRQAEQNEANAKREQEDSEAAERRRNCDIARGNLRNLQIGGRQVRFDPKTGDRAFLSDDEITQATRDAQRAMDEWCSPQTAQR